VAGLARTGASVTVALELAGGTPLRSRITGESAELLGLDQGQSVIALFKATAVRITGPGEAAGELHAKDSHANVLAGTVTLGSTDDSPDEAEISIGLPGGTGVVGFARQPGSLSPGQPALAIVDESAVVLALGD
jgi:molybdate transport system regulatory protein